MTTALRTKTLKALVWSFFERVGQQGIQFVISIILARLLLPEQFGLIVMVTIFMAIAQSFIDSGFGSALIQKKNVTHVDECSIFYFNIFVGFLAAGLLCLAAPWIADFYNQPLLVPLTCALSLNLIINAFGLVQTTLLTKHMDFKTQLKVGLIAVVISGAIGITMAVNGFGVWSLVAQSLSSNFSRTILLWLFNSWRPSLIVSLDSMRGMFAFGSRLLVSGLLNTVFQNVYPMVIGKLFPPAALGFYSRAKGIQRFPAEMLSSIVSRVAFPIFSILQDDSNRLKRGMRKALATLAFANFPIMIGLAVVAKPLVLVLLTEKWAPCILYLQLICVAGMLFPFHVINLSLLQAKGRSDLFLRLEIIKKIRIVVFIAITYRWGIEGMLCGEIIGSTLVYYLNCYYTDKLINYPFKEQMLDCAPYLATGIAMGSGVYSVQFLQFSSNFILLFFQILTGISLYIVLNCIFKTSAYVETYEILRDKVKPRICREFRKYYG